MGCFVALFNTLERCPMKTVVFLITLAIVFVAATSSVAQQPSVSDVATPELPANLSGTWYRTLDGRFGNTWKLVNHGNGTGVVTFWSNIRDCSMVNVPAKIEYDGVNLKITATGQMACTDNWSAILTRKGNGFEGVINANMNPSNPTVRVTAK